MTQVTQQVTISKLTYKQGFAFKTQRLLEKGFLDRAKKLRTK